MTSTSPPPRAQETARELPQALVDFIYQMRTNMTYREAVEAIEQRDAETRRAAITDMAKWIRNGTLPPIGDASAFILTYPLANHIADCMLKRAAASPASTAKEEP